MSSENSIYGEYIQLTNKYRAKYGASTIVLLQVGAFFEIYGFRCPTTNTIQKTSIVDNLLRFSLNLLLSLSIYGNLVTSYGFAI